jgi:hypothetical protein
LTIPPPPDPFQIPEEGQDSLPEILGGFPRHLTTQLIEEGEDSQHRREMISSWVLGLALALLALTYPQERLLGEAFGEVFERGAFWTPWQRVHQFLAQLLDVHAEQLRFVSSALAFGACLPVALSIARRFGCSFGLSLVGCTITLLSPTAWLAGTTPGLAAPALLLMLLLMREMWRECGPSPARCLVVWGVLIAFQPTMVLLWPALLLACLFTQEESARRKRTCLIWSLGGLLALGAMTTIGLADWDPQPMPSRLDLDGTRWSLDPRVWPRLAGLVPGLGLSAVGLASLWLLRRNESELPPPRWLLLWALLPALGLLPNSALGWDASYQWLLPIALVGWFDLLARLEVDGGRLLGAAGLLAQATLLIGLISYAQNSDPLARWRSHAHQFLEPGDVVITGHAEHAYLVSHRWGQMSVVLGAAEKESPDPEFVEGVYCNERSDTNLRVKTQHAHAWAAEGLEAHGLGFRVILDRPFPDHSEGIASVIDSRLAEIVEYHSLVVPAEETQ